jgi:hypothetical protein
MLRRLLCKRTRAGRIDENSTGGRGHQAASAFTLSIVAKGTPLLLGRGAACVCVAAS